MKSAIHAPRTGRSARLLGALAWTFLLVASARAARGDPGPNDSTAVLPPRLPPPAVSMGQPSRSELRWGPMGGYAFDGGRALTRVYARAGWTDGLPALSWMTAGVEGSVGSSGPSPRTSLGVYAGLPWFTVGVDQNFPNHHPIFGMQLQVPLRRGGLWGQGDLLRVDYRPAQKELLVGFSLVKPFGTYRMTRPRNTAVELPPGSMPRAGRAGLSPRTLEALAEVRSSVRWMDELLTPRFACGDDFEKSAQRYRDHIREPGHGFVQEDSTYHRALAAAFAGAIESDDAAGDALARAAERVIFNQVLLPFDRAFGREKSHPDAGGLCRRAAVEFDRRLGDSPWLLGAADSGAAARRALAGAVFGRVLRDIEDASERAFGRWSGKFLGWDNRASMAWLPLNYGLRPEQYDTQAEWDDVLGRLTEEPFLDANTIEYLMLEQFHLELKRMIRHTERYQVTIVHDFRSTGSDGDTDIYGWDMVADGYVTAFTEAVRALDRGERESLPQFFLFLDAHYYRQRNGRPLVTFLENLYNPGTIRLHNKAIEDQVRAAHQDLLAAIHDSKALAGLDEERLAALFKVNVSVTNPLDPAFGMDVFRRDHRKIGFRDVFEEDPAAGEALFTGQGIGAQYNGSGWEDRSMRVRGPALAQLKSGTRELFLGQGFRSSEVPFYLKPRPLAPDHAARCRKLIAAGWTVPVSIVMNETGYGSKQANVLKATIYNLAPPRSFLLCYDSLWISEFWAGMFVGMAARGVHVLPIGATPGNSPSNGTPTLHFVRETLHTMFQAQQYFAEDAQRSGGLLRVGLYAAHAPVEDFRRRGQDFLVGLAANPFLLDLFPMHPEARDSLLGFIGEYDEVPLVALRLKPKPSLHIKNQLFGTWEAFRVFGLPEWGPLVRRYLDVRQKQMEGRAAEGIRPELLRGTGGAAHEAGDLIDAFGRRLDEISPDARKRVIYTLTTGSQNQNPRSMMLDGEVLVAASGPGCLVTGIDFIFILGITTWPTNEEEFDRLCPPVSIPFLLRPLGGFLHDIN